VRQKFDGKAKLLLQRQIYGYREIGRVGEDSVAAIAELPLLPAKRMSGMRRTDDNHYYSYLIN
jgi:hypothetical protein